ncbi:MAG: FG-GAP-like repeat-containing protein [bacterium]
MMTEKDVRTLTLTATLAVTFMLPSGLLAQEFEFRRDLAPFPVQGADGQDIQFPFLGGFNAPRPQFVDIDGDSDLDLFIQEENGTITRPGRLMFFDNTGTSTRFRWRWRTDEYQGLDIGNWYKFVDVDHDGDFDLFTESPFALVRYWRNIGTASQAEFVLALDSLRDIEGTLVNFDIGSLPELADIDCDGDLDLLVGRSAAGTITLFESKGLDGAGLPLFEEIAGNFQDISIIGEGTPGSAATMGRGNGVPTTAATRQNGVARHGSNALTVVDIENDQDPDIFWGDLFEDSIVFLANSGTCQQPEIHLTTRDFPISQPVRTGGFNAPRFADLDADGDLDLLVAVLGGVFSPIENLAENFFFYRNVGSATRPAFAQISRQFIPNLDLGSNTLPALVDIDADGDLDLFIGNEVSPDTLDTARLLFFENQGKPNAPAFRLVNPDFLGVNIGFNYAPAFGDIDADGDQDLFIGEWNGKLNFIENLGSPHAFVMAPTQEEVTALIDGEIKPIDIGNNNAPALTDIDGDGDLDLFVGEFLGNLNFFENAGSATTPAFVFRSKDYAAIDVGLYSTPVFSDLDADGDPDLLLGSEQNGVTFYRNTGSGGFIEQADLPLRVLDRSAPAPADIDNDGDLDVLLGTAKGGLLFYDNRKFVTAVEPRRDETVPDNFVLRQNYPNPFNPQTTISYRLPGHARVKLVIYDLLGRTVRTLLDTPQPAGSYEITWDGKDESGAGVSSGIYFYHLRAGTLAATRRMLLLQ